MSPPLKIVAHYNDGRVLHGTTSNFWPRHPVFHLHNGSAEPTAVILDELKAVFVVKAFTGNSGVGELSDEPSTHSIGGKAIGVEFKDGEVIYGSVMELDRGGIGFFLFPFDPSSNNLRVFVINKSVRRVTAS